MAGGLICVACERRLWQKGRECSLCEKTFCAGHSMPFLFPDGMLHKQGGGRNYVCHECRPNAEALVALHQEDRMFLAEDRRGEAVRRGQDWAAPAEMCQQCLECCAPCTAHCQICGSALCAQHVNHQPLSCGPRAPRPLQVCRHCVEVARARAEARDAVRAAVASVHRGNLAVQRLELAVAAMELGAGPRLEKAEDCAACGLQFSSSSWRHHCHACGLSLCSTCLCGRAGCLVQGPRCPHKARLPQCGSTREERVCHRCLDLVGLRATARAAAEAISDAAWRSAEHCLRVREFLADPEGFPLYEQAYVDTVSSKALRAGNFAVQGAKLVAPVLSMPWAIGVNAAHFAWNYGQYGLAGLLVRGEIMEGLRTLVSMSSGIQSIHAKDLAVGMIYLDAAQRRELRDNPEGAGESAAKYGRPVPVAVLEALISLAVLGMHVPYKNEPSEAQRYARQQHWRLVTHRLSSSAKHQPAWCLCIRRERQMAVVAIRGTALEESMGGDLFTDVDAEPAEVLGADGRTLVAHKGALLAARYLEAELRPTLRFLAEAGYQIVVTGHSLGGAVAALLVWLLRYGTDGERLPDLAVVRGIGYGLPSVVDHGTAQDMKPFFTSVVNPMDVVPRLTVHTIRRLGTDIVACARQSDSDLDEDMRSYVEWFRTVCAPRVREDKPLQPTADAQVMPDNKAGGSQCRAAAAASGAGGAGAMDRFLGPDGFEVLFGKDPFPGSTMHTMSAESTDDIRECKRVCKDRGYGAFVVWKGRAYFRPHTVRECLDHATDAPNSTAYLNWHGEDRAAAADNASGQARAGELFVPGSIVWIYRMNGHLDAAVVPCDLPELRRITLDKRMMKDHASMSYYTALLGVRARRGVEAAAPPVRWEKFSDAGRHCPCCNSIFEWMQTARSEKQRWRAMTNCRACGLVVCYGCATTQRALPEQGILEPARVCDRCMWRGPEGGAALQEIPEIARLLGAGAEGPP